MKIGKRYTWEEYRRAFFDEPARRLPRDGGAAGRLLADEARKELRSALHKWKRKEGI